MKEYKAGLFTKITYIGIRIIGLIALYVILRFFISLKITLIIETLAILYIAYQIFFDDNIKFQIEGYELRYYKNNKLVKIYDLRNTTVKYTRTNNSSFTFEVNGDIIDCDPLGLTQSESLYYDINEIQNEVNPTVLNPEEKL